MVKFLRGGNFWSGVCADVFSSGVLSFSTARSDETSIYRGFSLDL
jgi:hypothetical protein